MIGIGVSIKPNEAVYFPIAYWDNPSQQLVTLVDEEFERSFVEELCSILKTKKLVMHNGVFDIAVMYHSYGVNLIDALYADTILMKHTVDEERPFGLKDIAEQYKTYIGFTTEEAANQEQLDLKESVIANGGKWTKDQKDIYKADLSIIGKYCCADVDLTLKLFEFFASRLEEERLEEFFYDQEVMPLYRKATIPMKLKGVYVDVDYFKRLEKELESDIIKLTDSIFNDVREDIRPMVEKILDEKVKETKTGRYAEGVLQYYNLPIPSNKKTGKPTLAKSALQSLLTTYPDHPALKWLLHEGSENENSGPRLSRDVRYAVKKAIFVDSNPDLPEVFNLSSNAHLSWLIFDKYGEEPKSYSRTTGEPQVDKNSLETYDHLPFIRKLLELKKEEKLLSTYVKPILESNVGGWIYPSMLQFGTTSGRYSCAGGLNLQTLPRFEKPKRCSQGKCEGKLKVVEPDLIHINTKCESCGHEQRILNGFMIKKGFIAPPGYKIVNADFSSLEPRIFSWVSGDPGLKNVWKKGLDLYSQIAIDVFNLSGVSAKESDPNYLKKKNPEYRQLSKVFTLAVPYGANEYRIAQLMKIEPEEAKDIINRYLDAYPKLKDYMMNQEIQARSDGYVRTKFGRIRHLPECKRMYKEYRNTLYNKSSMKRYFGDEAGSKIYYEFRNALNNSKNFPIQATAAHVANAALIKLADSFEKHKIEGHIALQVHDEITCIVREDQANLVAELLQDAMENNFITREIDIPIIAEPLIATNLADAK